MRNIRPLLALILIATIPLAAQAAEKAQGQKSSAPLTVGDFAVMLAATTGKGPALEVKGAAEALVKAGVPLGNPKAVLTEEKLVEILGFYGVRVKSSTPRQSVSRSKADAALLLVAGTLSSVGTARAGSASTPSTLNDCLAESNHGQCVGCCKLLGGDANGCANFCQQIKVSEGEPLP